jgi:hypothetical protein
MATLIQLVENGEKAQNFVASLTAVTNFPAATTSENVLVCVCGVLSANLSGALTPTIQPPSTPGLDWQLAIGGMTDPALVGEENEVAAVSIYYALNAPSISNTVKTSVTATTGSVATYLQVGVTLLEINGPTYLDFILGPVAGDDGLPTIGTIETLNTNLLIVSNASAIEGVWPLVAGWTGFSAGGSAFGGASSAYILTAPPGVYPSPFSGPPPLQELIYPWSCVAVAFGPAVPTVTNVNPNNGPIAGGTPVTIVGTGVSPGDTVSFGGNAATSVVVVSSTQITCVTPPGTAGPVTVSVTGSNGTGSLPNGYTYTQPVLTVSPLSLSFAATVLIHRDLSQGLSISNTGDGTLIWTVASDSPWLSVDTPSGIGNATIGVLVDITGLSAGVYNGNLTVTAPGATNSPQVVPVTLTLTSPTPCVPVGGNGIYLPDLQLYIGPATALYTSMVPTAAMSVNESYTQGRTAVIIDFNDSEGLYSRDLGTVFSWPASSRTVLDLWQPSIIPLDDDIYERMSFHFLMSSISGVGWQHLREVNLAYSSTADANLLLTFDQWPAINVLIPNSNGAEIKTKFVIPVNKWKLIEGFLSCPQPLMLWGSDVQFKIKSWGSAEAYRIVKPLAS